MSTITSELLNKVIGLDGEQQDNHTEKWHHIRSHLDYMTDEQFADLYRTCFNSDGLVRASSFKYDHQHVAMIESYIKNLRGKFNGHFMSLHDLMRESGITLPKYRDKFFYEHTLKAMRALAENRNYGI